MGSSQVIVLDTHALIWWVNDTDRLSMDARAAINEAVAEGSVSVSSISVWEIAMLVDRKRLTLTMDVRDWIAKCESLPFLHFVPVTNDIALKAVQLLGDMHSDPADRIIAATAIITGAVLVTMDEKLRAHPYVKTVW